MGRSLRKCGASAVVVGEVSDAVRDFVVGFWCQSRRAARAPQGRGGRVESECHPSPLTRLLTYLTHLFTYLLYLLS
jgi:hypothetical protein